MFPFFKHKTKDNEIKSKSATNILLSQIIENKKEIAKLNFLSPIQIENILKNNKDIDFLDFEFKKEMDYPDIEYLTNKLMPDIKENRNKKDMSAEKVMSGAIIGDIIGSHYEFEPHDYTYSLTEELPPKFSTYTDDTVLSIATMKAIKENKDNPDFRKHYVDAHNKYPNVGYGSSFVMWAMGKTIDGEKIDNNKGYHSFANGCAMRVSYIASAYDDIKDFIKHTIDSVMTTHDHTESVKNTVVIAVCIWMALHQYTKEEIMEYCKTIYTGNLNKLYFGYCQYDINMETDNVSNAETRDSLFVNYAVPIAIRYFYETNNFVECMRKINYHFGDTDTICAIAGGLCMAYYGKSGLDDDKIFHTYNIDSVIKSL